MGAKKNYRLVAFLEKERLREGNVRRARQEARRIARYLEKHYNAVVYGIGSLFDPLRPFKESSDIDLVVKGLPKRAYFKIIGEIDALTSFPLDIIPWEDANSLVLETVRERGVRL